MNKILLYSFAFSYFILLTENSLANTQNDHEKLLQFADNLFSEMEYYRAITEYRRFLFYNPKAPIAPSVHFRIFDCYFVGERYAEALAWSRRIRDLYSSNHEVSGKAELSIGEALLKLENFPRARQHFETVVKSKLHPEIIAQAYYSIGITYLKEDKWQEASEAFATVSPGTSIFDKAQVTSSKAFDGAFLAYKRPFVAGLLNVVPGFGYAYVGMPKTGLSAFLVNGLFATATYSAFKKEETGVGLLLGVLSFGWYTGGIYGAVVNANKHNLRIKQDFWDRF